MEYFFPANNVGEPTANVLKQTSTARTSRAENALHGRVEKARRYAAPKTAVYLDASITAIKHKSFFTLTWITFTQFILVEFELGPR